MHKLPITTVLNAVLRIKTAKASATLPPEIILIKVFKDWTKPIISRHVNEGIIQIK